MVNAVFYMNVVARKLYFAARDLQMRGNCSIQMWGLGPGPYFLIFAIFAVYRSHSKGCNDGQWCRQNVQKKTACQNVVPEIYGSCLSEQSKKVKASHARYRSLGPELIPVYRQSVRSGIGCHYFSPVLRLPSQPQSITATWPVPGYTAWWQRHIGVNNLPKVVMLLCPE